MTNTDEFFWSRQSVATELSHTICCPLDSPACSLRFRERADSPSSGKAQEAPEWARFQLATHSRADIDAALVDIWPETEQLDWEALTDGRIRELPAIVGALWTVIIRGPAQLLKDRTPIPENQAAASRFGFVSKHQAEHILRHRWEEIAAEQDSAIGQIIDWLNDGERRPPPPPYVPISCSRSLHFWSFSGTPASTAYCRCHRVQWWERSLIPE